MASINEMRLQLTNWFAQQTLSRKMTIAGALVVSIIGIVAFVWQLNKTQMEVLYNDLAREDTAAIIQKLDQQNIPYQVRDDGAILVRSGEQYRLRVTLASEGLPYGGARFGMEVFEQSSIGMTRSRERILHQNALRGELIRTINALSVVKSCDVQYQTPEENVFVDMQQPPTASVVVHLNPGETLTATQIKGVKHIVASAIERLSPENVQVIDDKGAVLSDAERQGQLDPTTRQFQLQRDYERMIKDKIVSALEFSYGRGRVVAEVSADLDFTQVEEISRINEQDSTVPIEEEVLINIRDGQGPRPGGVAGSDSNRPLEADTATLQTTTSADMQSRMTKTRFDVGYVESRTIRPATTLRKVQVAVVIDENYDQGAAGNGAMVEEAPLRLTVQEIADKRAVAIAQVEDTVQRIMGFDDTTRDDSLSVRFDYFNQDMLPAPDREIALTLDERFQRWAPHLVMPAVLLLSIMILVMMVIRPFLRHLEGPQEPITAGADIRTVAELEAALDPQVRAQLEAQTSQMEKTAELLKNREREQLHKQVDDMAKRDPEKSAKMLKSWLESS